VFLIETIDFEIGR